MSENPQKTSSLRGTFRQLLQHTHAGTALIGAAIADQQLQDALLTKMRSLSRKLTDSIFSGYGPLSSFAAKIDLAFAFELIDEPTHERLTAARKIRNSFAHSDKFLTFDSPEISSALNKLPYNGNKALSNQDLYVWHLTAVEAHLVSVAGPTILKPSAPKGTGAEPSGAANRSQPVGPDTHPTLPAAGSGG